jgi:hypothetical protein
MWLGLMHGHWEVEAADIDDLLTEDSEDQSIHSGIGVVVPAEQILAAISPFLEPYAEMRRHELRDEQSNQEPPAHDIEGID